jgi:hypoxanthine phosphoribosyltransferase
MVSSQDVSWNDIEYLVQILSENILKLSRTFSSITTLSRGGLIPSRLLADSLGIKKIFIDQNKIYSNSLFVDDIFDSGKTFDNIFSKVDDPSNFVFATLFARRGMKFPSQLIYGAKTIDNSYVVFPWDKFEFQNTLK